jgi:SAM-dependent methyltransferase
MPGVAPDGSPVEVFAALPPRGIPELLHAQIASGGSVLELGCGAGRVTRGLLDLGHRVWAVDESPEMLDRVDPRAERIEADIWALDLRMRFDAVVAGSYLVNQWAPLLLATCARHVREDGVVLVQRYSPAWARAEQGGTSRSGDVETTIDPIRCVGDRISFTATYTLGANSWSHTIDATVLDDRALEMQAAYAGLRHDGVFDDYDEWVALVPNSAGVGR